MVGSGSINLSGSGTLASSLEIAKAAGGQVQLIGSVTVNGDLSQTSGDFVVAIGGRLRRVGLRERAVPGRDAHPTASPGSSTSPET